MSFGIYVGVDQSDVCAVNHDGMTYRCFVYRNNDKHTVEASLFVEQEDGQMVLVDQSAIAQAPPLGETVPGLDCPRIVGAGRYFVVTLVRPQTDVLEKYVLDLEAISSGWTGEPLGSIGEGRLYDTCMLGGTTDMIVVWKTSTTDQYIIQRYESPYALADVDYSVARVISDTEDTRVLSVAADSGANRIMVAVEEENEGRRLIIAPFLAAGGSSVTPQPAFVGLPDGHQYAAVGMCRLRDGDWAIIAEARPPGAYSAETMDTRHLLWSSTNDFGIMQAGYCEVPGLCLMSRPWEWSSGSLGPGVWIPDVFAVVGFKSASLDYGWEQTYAYVLNLDYQNFDNSTHGIVASAIMNGAVDARPSGESRGTQSDGQPSYLGGTSAVNGPDRALTVGERDSWKRINHLSNVSNPPLYELGPDRKTVSVAAGFWQRLMAGNVLSDPAPTPSLHPAMPSVRSIRFYHEDPWMTARDSKEPSLPASPQYKGAHHRPIGYPTEVSGALVFGGGVTQTFDGAQLCELGFFWKPEILLPDHATGPVGPDERQYWYTATYTWTDDKGQLHRSGPATPVRVITTGPIASDNTVELLVRTMTISMKDEELYYDGASPINIEIWRTYYDDAAFQVDPETGYFIFKRVFTGSRSGAIGTQLRDTPVNDRNVWAQTITDGVPDGLVAFAEPMPWQLASGVGFDPPPPKPHTPLSIMTSWNNRLWGVNPEDSRVIEYSEEVLPIGTQYVMPEFNDVNQFRFDSRGEITALFPMDNALVVFTREGIFALTGQGNAGGGGSNLELQVLAEGTGCIEPRSIVYGPPGLFFQSAKGFYILSRAFELDYVTAGAAIEDIIRDAGNVRGAVLVEDRHQIMLVLNGSTRGNPRIATYDYHHRLWSLATVPEMAIGGAVNPRYHDMQSSVVWRSYSGETLHVFLQQGGGLGVERSKDDLVFADVDYSETAVPVPMDITVEWIHLAGIAGYKKVNEIGIQLEKTNDVQVTVEVQYDLDGSYPEGAPTDTFTDLATAGYVRVRPSIRKCSAMRIRVYESGDGAGGPVPLTENLKISSLTLKVGIKTGPRKVPDTQVGS
jgi:hypothetical protein